MKTILAIVILQHLQVAYGQNCNAVYKTLPHLEHRARSYTKAANEMYLTDDRLVYKSYNVRKMNIPNDHKSPVVTMCGTYYPLWMDGAVPDETDGVVVRTACIFSFNAFCSTKIPIEVRNCGTHMIYKLGPTRSYNSAYCFEVGLGFNCPQADACSNTNSVCSRDTCTCNSGFYDDNGNNTKGGTCQPSLRYIYDF